MQVVAVIEEATVAGKPVKINNLRLGYVKLHFVRLGLVE